MTNKKKTLGNSPLEAYFSSSLIEADPASHSTEVVQCSDDGDSARKQRITIHLPIGLIERVKNVVYWEPGLTLTGFAQEAFEKAVDSLEERRGSSYPTRHQKLLKGGRPLA